MSLERLVNLLEDLRSLVEEFPSTPEEMLTALGYQGYEIDRIKHDADRMQQKVQEIEAGYAIVRGAWQPTTLADVKAAESEARNFETRVKKAVASFQAGNGDTSPILGAGFPSGVAGLDKAKRRLEVLKIRFKLLRQQERKTRNASPQAPSPDRESFRKFVAGEQ